MRSGRGLRFFLLYFVFFFAWVLLELSCTAVATTAAESRRHHQQPHHDDETHVSTTTISTTTDSSSSQSTSTVCEHVIDASSSSTISTSVCHSNAAAGAPNSNDTTRQPRNDATTPSSSSSTTTTPVKSTPRVPNSCQLVMAESSLPNAGWGMFTLTHRYRGDAILPGDSIVQVVDLNDTTAWGMRLLLHDYAWDAHETGGIYEALRVISLAPGIGSLANGHVARYNVLPNLPTVDEAGLTRDESPGAGAVSHYFNYTFHVQTSVLRVGEEILLNYGVNWFQERQAKLTPTLQEQQVQQQQQSHPAPSPTTSASSSSSTSKPPTLSILQQQAPPRRSKDWLMEHGLCLDNLRPGPSTIPHAGRGAFTTRALPQGSIVAPIPVLPILKQSLQITRLRSKTTNQPQRHDKHQPQANNNNNDDDEEEEVVHLQQLLLNYCYGHANSSLLLYPYAPMVNFINHASATATSTMTSPTNRRRLQPNVRLEWADDSDTFHRNADYRNMTIPQLLQQNYSGLLLQLVATRDLRRGEEVLLDYGDDWQAAWDRHVTTTWRPNVDHYTPSYVMDDVVRNLRTVQEQRVQQPYPSNIFTSCYYRYSDHKEQAEQQYRQEQQEEKSSATSSAAPTAKHQVTTFRWNATRDLLLDMRYLRPCEVLAREHVAIGASGKPATVYTVRMRNRFGLSATERIPTNMIHIVTHVPRFAIRFSDKLYTTDQHLEQAFRHAIGIPSLLFPNQWNDVVEE